MLTVSVLNKEEILKILQDAQDFKDGIVWQPERKIFVSNLFFENSTRTKVSFEVAERKLGLEVVPFDVSTSSVNKGESLYDTAKTLESIGINLLVIRHSENEYYQKLENIKIPIINGGDGTGNHPSQTILDLMTIQQEFGTLENLTVGIVGDIKHSRVARSLAQALEKFNSKIIYSSPKDWFDANENQFLPIDDLVEKVDVLVLLRIQHERHSEKSNFNQDNYLQNFGLTKEREIRMKTSAIIMHPAPINRGVEIDDDLVECARSRIFMQMENGVFARMAIIKRALELKNLKH